MLTVGQLIWVSVRPLLRLMICVGSGFALTKADIFPAVASRGAGQIALNIAMPSLMFSKIVPAFNSDNIHALGPLVLVAVLYQVIGLLIAVFTKRLFWVPHRFRYGILVAGAFGNNGDIPNSVLMSICGSAPFGSVEDQNLSVAYISVFILVSMMALFPMGGHKLVAKDFVGPDVEDDEVRQNMRRERKAMLLGWVGLVRRCRSASPPHRADGDPEEKPESEKNEKSESVQIQSPQPLFVAPTPRRPALLHQNSGKHVSFYPEEPASTVVPTEPALSRVCSPITTEVIQSRMTSPAPTTTHVETVHHNAGASSSVLPKSSAIALNQPNSRLRRTKDIMVPFLRSLLSPASLSIILSFPIALITPFKALFVPIVNSPIPNGPDGLPPLSFLLDTATFIGGASVPLGLICLGSALARLKMPRSQWSSLPLGAMSSLAAGKLILSPILGVLICQGLTKVGLIDENDKVLRLVCIFLSCLPTATTQVFLTQIYSGTGEAEHLPAFLIPQYIMMILSMTALIVFTLNLLF